MAEQTFSMVFDGYWREVNKGGVPDKSGVYCVYACTYDQKTKNLSIRMLIYIGEADDVRVRLATHERQEDWETHLEDGEVLCYSFAPSAAANRERCEAALINEHQPPENTEYKDAFPFDKTTINTTGKNKFLKPKFTVLRS